MYLWRAVDHEGEVLEILVQRRRDRSAAVKLMRKLLRKQGFSPIRVTTDKLDPHVGVVNLSCGAEHAARSASARPRRDIDDAVFAVCEGSGGRFQVAARRPLLCLTADRVPDGAVRASPPRRSFGCRLRRSMG